MKLERERRLQVPFVRVRKEDEKVEYKESTRDLNIRGHIRRVGTLPAIRYTYLRPVFEES